MATSGGASGGGGGGFYGAAYSGDFVADGVHGAPSQTNLPFTGGGTALLPTVTTRGGPTVAYSMNTDQYFHDLTINAGVAWMTAGDRLFIADTLTLNGVIDFCSLTSGGASVASATNATGAVGVPSTTDPLTGSGPGGAGNTGAGSNGAVPVAQTLAVPLFTLAVGAHGGAGGGASGGAAGVVPHLQERHGLPYSQPAPGGYGFTAGGFTVWAGGSGGGGGQGDAVNAGGGGGAGGGVTMIFARNIIGSGAIYASGGDGAAGVAGNANGGGGGGGGLIVVVTQSAVWTPGAGPAGLGAYTIPGITLSAPGGNGGAGVGTGAAGSNGNTGNVIVIPG